MSKYGVFPGPYFPPHSGVSLRIQSECGQIRTRKKSEFGYFSHGVDCYDSENGSKFFTDIFKYCSSEKENVKQTEN